MNNHFHLLVSTPEGNISASMYYFLKEVSKQITKESGRINQTFGGPFHSSLIKNYHYYMHAYKYVYRNPIEAGLIKCADHYPYSTLSGKIGLQKLIIPIEEDTLLFDNFEDTLEWINTDYRIGDKDQIRNALRKSEFKLAKDKDTKKESHLEWQKL